MLYSPFLERVAKRWVDLVTNCWVLKSLHETTNIWPRSAFEVEIGSLQDNPSGFLLQFGLFHDTLQVQAAISTEPFTSDVTGSFG